MGNSGIFLLMFPLSVYLVHQTCQAVSSTQQLPLDYRGILSDVVVGKIAAFGCCNVYLPTDRIALLEPVERCAGLDSGHLLFCEAIELVLPLRIAPLVGRFGQGAVPNCMEIALPAEEPYGNGVAAPVAQVPRVHRLGQVTAQVYQHFQVELLLCRVELTVFKLRHDPVDGLDDVPVRILRHGLVSETFIDIGIMPGRGVGILRRVARRVEPVGPIYHRGSAEDLVDFLCGLGREVAFGDVGDYVVPFLSPGQCPGRSQQA